MRERSASLPLAGKAQQNQLTHARDFNPIPMVKIIAEGIDSVPLVHNRCACLKAIESSPWRLDKLARHPAYALCIVE